MWRETMSSQRIPERWKTRKGVEETLAELLLKCKIKKKKQPNNQLQKKKHYKIKADIAGKFPQNSKKKFL